MHSVSNAMSPFHSRVAELIWAACKGEYVRFLVCVCMPSSCPVPWYRTDYKYNLAHACHTAMADDDLLTICITWSDTATCGQRAAKICLLLLLCTILTCLACHRFICNFKNLSIGWHRPPQVSILSRCILSGLLHVCDLRLIKSQRTMAQWFPDAQFWCRSRTSCWSCWRLHVL